MDNPPDSTCTGRPSEWWHILQSLLGFLRFYMFPRLRPNPFIPSALPAAHSFRRGKLLSDFRQVCARNAKFFRTADVTVLRTHTFDCPMLFLHVKKHTRAVTPLLLLNQVTMVRWSTCNKPGVNLLFGNSHPLIGPLLHTFDRTVTTPPDVSSPPRPSR